jgi:hypothetical protein
MLCNLCKLFSFTEKLRKYCLTVTSERYIVKYIRSHKVRTYKLLK